MNDEPSAWWPVALALVVVGLAGLVLFLLAMRWRARVRDRADELASSERVLNDLFDEFPDALLIVDSSGIVRRANAGALRLLGPERHGSAAERSGVEGSEANAIFDYEVDDPTGSLGSADRSPLIGRTLSSLMPMGVEAQVARWVKQLFAVPAVASSERTSGIGWVPDTMRCKIGNAVDARTLEFTGERRTDGSSVIATVVVRDLTATAILEDDLAAARQRFDRSIAGSPTGVAVTRISDGRIIAANDALAEMLMMPVELLVGCTLREFTHPDDISTVQPLRAQLEIGAVDSFKTEQRFRRRDGDHVWARVHVTVIDDQGSPAEIVHVEDISESVVMSERLRHAERHDALTGLPNRWNFRQLLEDRLHHRDAGELAVLFADLDRFRYVNDSLGHDVGDQVLRGLARRLQEGLPPDASLARFGGDEFVVATTRSAKEVADALHAVANEPIVVDGQELFVTLSLGIAVVADELTSANDLIRDADTALARAKRRGGNCVEYFNATEFPSAAQVLQTTGEIRRGLSRGEFVPYFQPIINLRSGEVTGHEALVRWLHPDRGLLQPDDFMPVLAEAGLVSELGTLMLREALAHAVLWDNVPQFADLGTTMSVNISTHQLLDPNFLPTVVNALTESAFDPDRVWLEITEHALLADEQHSADRLTELRSLGLHLAVDDFGTGYSSLTYLKRFPVEAIKIDKTFVRGLGIDAEDSSIVEAVARLGQSLGLTVIAEGVESPLHLQRLRDLDVDLAQGYLFGRPRPANLIEFFDSQPEADPFDPTSRPGPAD